MTPPRPRPSKAENIVGAIVTSVMAIFLLMVVWDLNAWGGIRPLDLLDPPRPGAPTLQQEPARQEDYPVPNIGSRSASELSASEAKGACVWMAREKGWAPRSSPPPISRSADGWAWRDFSRDGAQSWSCVLLREGIHLFKTPPGMTID
ncbi:hypothetical protein [Deinococcus radiopugnans]|uniref:hypothetical protein n=1 Tax=Deinococcus radiopugnans TaxID=57497 RepID=UPI0012E0371E|nr:hypothetical protein [Deinococcus radiopugnans]